MLGHKSTKLATLLPKRIGSPLEDRRLHKSVIHELHVSTEARYALSGVPLQELPEPLASC